MDCSATADVSGVQRPDMHRLPVSVSFTSCRSAMLARHGLPVTVGGSAMQQPHGAAARQDHQPGAGAPQLPASHAGSAVRRRADRRCHLDDRCGERSRSAAIEAGSRSGGSPGDGVHLMAVSAAPGDRAHWTLQLHGGRHRDHLRPRHSAGTSVARHRRRLAAAINAAAGCVPGSRL